MYFSISLAALVTIPAVNALVYVDGTVCMVFVIAYEKLIGPGKTAGSWVEFVECLLL